MYSLIRSQTSLLAVGSNPDEGSSNTMNLVSPARAIASYNFLFYPPDKVLANESILCSIESLFKMVLVYKVISSSVICLNLQK